MKEVEHMNIELRLETPGGLCGDGKGCSRGVLERIRSGLHGALPGARHAQQ